MPSTETRPVESDADTGEDDGYAHYARKEEITRAAVLGGTVPMWEWIGDDGATTFSY